MGFDEWYLPKKHFLDDCESGYFECYEAGEASRQGEVDEFKNRIDESLDFLHSSNHYDEYYISQAIKILKGESNE